MTRSSFTIVFWLFLTALSVREVVPDDRDFFEARIRPVLIQHCYECHSSGAAKVQGGLRVDFRDGLRQGGDSGAAIQPGRPSESLLLSALKYESIEMPPAGKLPDAVIADFERWIEDGAVDPRDHPPSASEAAEVAWKLRLAARRHWWSLQLPQSVTPPEVNDPVWEREPVDRFILAKLHAAELTPSPHADAETLLRRLSFVLTGLPPRGERVAAFRRDFAKNADAALSSLVDELLNSPHFGERFARHWMDVARYTDTYGYEWDIPAKGAWEYRDYLIRAFNDDVGFDQLIREQIAGDLLSTQRIHGEAKVNESLIGPMFYHMGEHRHGSSLDFNGIHQEMIDNKIDAFSKAFLGLTVACARCHDHKLDAISQADYYALAGIFMTPRWTARSIDSPDRYSAEISELKRLRREIRLALSQAWRDKVNSKLLEGASLKQWAMEHRDKLKTDNLEDVGYPISRLLALSEHRPQPNEGEMLSDVNLHSHTIDMAVRDMWKQLADEWANTRQTRIKQNAETFTVLTEFDKPGFPDNWSVEGSGIEHGFVTDGTPLVSLDQDRLISCFLPRGYHTHALSSKLPGAVRLPAPEQFSRARVSLKLSGGEWAGRRSVPQNAFMAEEIFFFDPSASPSWMSFSRTGLRNGVTRVLTEITTASLNSNFPPRTGLAVAGKAALPATDDGFNKRSWFSLTGAVLHDSNSVPADALDAFTALYREPHPVSDDAAWQCVAGWLEGTLDRWREERVAQGDVQVLNWMLNQQLLPNDATSLPNVAVLVEKYREVEARINFPRSVNSMDEHGVEPVNYRLNIRGNVDEEGPEIRRDFLEVFSGSTAVGQAPGSGRLELAEHLASGRNPLVARVYVNRVWQWIFGTGIVETSNDFGKLGELPSHPELLDWLAIQFMEEGWSTKKLVRRLVLSQTFRQSGWVSEAGAECDPGNRLLHHYPTRRLEAEAIRDSMLAVSGRLDPQLYGPPINPPRPVEDAQKRLFSGPLDGNGRRSLYIKMSIMDPPKFLVCFNLPDPKLPTGRRDVTNVPAQALTLLNDPLVQHLAEVWATTIVQDGQNKPEERLRGMFLAALGREPSPDELERWTRVTVELAPSQENLMSDLQTWSDVAHSLFNTKEFIYYR